LRAKEGSRVLFMPHSPGIYIALVLKNADEIDYDNVLNEKSMNYNTNESFVLNNSQNE
jgi:hypothetical protein